MVSSAADPMDVSAEVLGRLHAQGRCACCCEEKPLERHHLLPRAAGGQGRENYVSICIGCHDLAHHVWGGGAAYVGPIELAAFVEALRSWRFDPPEGFEFESRRRDPNREDSEWATKVKARAAKRARRRLRRLEAAANVVLHPCRICGDSQAMVAMSRDAHGLLCDACCQTGFVQPWWQKLNEAVAR